MALQGPQSTKLIEDLSGESLTELLKRKIYLEKNKPLQAAIYKRSDIIEGKKYNGPAVIEEIDSTVVIPNNSILSRDHNQNIIAKFK